MSYISYNILSVHIWFVVVTDPLCEGCVIVDGHAYVAHDSDCSKFYHCYLTHDTNGDEIMVAKEENCAAKTFWSQEHKTCVTWENMVCPNPLSKYIMQMLNLQYVYYDVCVLNRKQLYLKNIKPKDITKPNIAEGS